MPTRFVFLYLAMLFLSSYLPGQNLVPNPGFEKHIRCPVNEGDFTGFVNDWFTFHSTPDYFRIDCTPAINLLCPYKPRSGRGFVGTSLLYKSDILQIYQHEYIQVKLLEPLKSTQPYYLQFYVYNAGCAYNIDRYDAHFSKLVVSEQPANGLLPVTPQFKNIQGIIPDGEYVRIGGCFLVDGGEQYMVLGNFNTDEETDTIRGRNNPVGYRGSYSFYDDVSLIELPDQEIYHESLSCVGDTIHAAQLLPIPDLPFQWDDGSQDSSITATMPGERWLNFSLPNCNITRKIKVDFRYCAPCQEPYIPNIFMPSANAPNNAFGMFFQCPPDFYHIQIFNRFGTLLFESFDSSETWDGRAFGDLAMPGVYIYLLRYKPFQETSLKQIAGDVTLVR